MRFTSFAIAVLLSIALISNGIGVQAKRKRSHLSASDTQATDASVEQKTAAVVSNGASSEVVVEKTTAKPKEEVQQKDASPISVVGGNNEIPPVAPQVPQTVTNEAGAAQPIPSMYYPPFPFYFPFQMMQQQPNWQVNSVQPGQPGQLGQPTFSQSQSQSQGAYHGMISLSQFGSAVDENGKPSGFQAPVPGLFYNPYGYNPYIPNYGGFQPGVAYREVYFPTKESKEATTGTTGAPVVTTGSGTAVEAGKPKAQEKILEEGKKEEKLKCRKPAILYHANVKPLSKEKQHVLSWLKDPTAAVCKEQFVVCQCDNNGKTERRWSFDHESKKCVLYEDPCPGKNNNSFTALNECLVSCWRM